MDDAPMGERLPPGLRFLKGLVIVLTLTMIGGVITVVSVIVTRMPRATAPAALLPAPLLPADLSLPEGTTATAVTAGAGWFAVVTSDGRILIFDRDGNVTQEIVLNPQQTP